MLVRSALLLLDFLITIIVRLPHARTRIGAEVTSSVHLAHDLTIAALRNAAHTGSKSAACTTLAQTLPLVRHVECGLAASGGNQGSAIQPGTNKVVTQHVSVLGSLVAPPQGDTVGSLIIRSNPADERDEIIREVELFSLVLLGSRHRQASERRQPGDL